VKVAFGGDERNATTDAVLDELRTYGHEIVAAFGPATGHDEQWPACGRGVAEAVAGGAAEIGIVMCWTGTGVSIAANKIAGARAALCTDPEQARGARKWNDANVLAMSLHFTAPETAREIVRAWLEQTEIDPSESANIDAIRDL
jgi:ribose 5-phosphate isomerase B